MGRMKSKHYGIILFFEIILIFSILFFSIILFTKTDSKNTITEDVALFEKNFEDQISSHSVNDKFKIINITNALHLDEGKKLINNIYEQVSELDELWSPVIKEEEYVRVTFEKELTSRNDITIYPKIISGDPIIEIYQENKIEKIGEFKNIKNNEYNKVYLTELDGKQDTFYLKIKNGQIKFNHILDPVFISFENPTPEDEVTINDSLGPASITINVSSTSSEHQFTTLDFDKSMILWLTFDHKENDTYVYDMSSYDNNAILYGNAEVTSGKFGDGIEFDATSNTYMSLPTEDFDYLEELTISMWVYPKKINDTWVRILHKADTSGNTRGFLIAQSADSRLVGVYQTAYSVGETTRMTSTLENNKWHHVVMTRNSLGIVDMYINGQLDNQGTSPAWVAGSGNNFHIGKRAGEDSLRFNGSVDEVIIFNRVLSTNEIASLYNATANQYEQEFTDLQEGNHTFQAHSVDELGNFNSTETRTLTVESFKPNVFFVSPTPNNEETIYDAFTIKANITTIGKTDIEEIKYYWNDTNYTFYDDSLLLMMNFNNNSLLGENNTLVYDASLYQNNGTIINAQWTTEGVHGGAYDFDGSTSYINLPTQNFDDLDDFLTVAMWIKVDNSGATQRIFHKSDDTRATTGFGLEKLGDNRLLGFYQPKTSGQIDRFSSSSLNVGEWYYVVMEYNGSSVNLYINGVLDNGATYGVTYSSGSGNNFYLGQRTEDPHWNFDGKLDEVRIWNKTLTQGELNQLYMTNIHKYDVDKWSIEVNQVKNATHFLDNGDYACKIIAKNANPNEGRTETRTIRIGGILTSTCRTLNQQGGVYVLTNDVSSAGTCFDISASDVILDCRGHTITYSTAGTSWTRGISISNHGATIKNCIVQDGNWSSINSGRDAIISYKGSNDPIYNITIYNNIMNSTLGSNFHNAPFLNLTKNTAHANTSSAIHIAGSNVSMKDNYAVSNHAGSNSYAISLNTINSSHINNTVININTGRAIMIDGNHNTYDGLYANSTDEPAVFLWQIHNSNFTNIHAYSENSDALVFQTIAENLTVTNSHFSSNTGYGLAVSSKNNTVINSTAISNTSYAISLSGTNNKVFNTNGTSTTSYAVLIQGTNSTVTGGTYTSNSTVIYLFNTNNLTFANNTMISGNKNSILLYLWNSFTNYFYHNNFTQTSSYYMREDTGGNTNNNYNTTINGVAQGNYYYGSETRNWVDTTGDGWTNTGTDYPMNATTWSARWIGSGTDYAPATDTKYFVTVWNTSETGVSNSTTITLPLVDHASSFYNFTVYWGDGTSSKVTSWNSVNKTHTYATQGVYEIIIQGDITGWQFNSGGDSQKLIEIKRWGQFRLGNAGNYFAGANNMIITTQDILDLTGTTNLSGTFNGCNNLTVSRINEWDTSNVTNMDSMFQNAANFNQNLSAWNIRNVSSMSNMFLGVTLSTSNYDALLIGWANQTPNLKNSVSFHGGNSQYSSNSLSAKNTILIGVHSWSITDGGPVARITLEILVPTEANINVTKEDDFDVQIRTRCLYDNCGNIELSLASTFLAIPGTLLSTNPINFTLNKDQDNITTFNLKGEGIINTTYSFYANAKIVSAPIINATTNTWNVTIVDNNITLINQCQNINAPGLYRLSNNISSNGSCISISSNNVILDCRGHTITYSLLGASDNMGIYSDSRDNITITDCNILDGNSSSTALDRFALFFHTVTNSLIEKSVATSNNNRAIYTYNSNNITIADSTGMSNASAGIYILGGQNNKLYRNSGISNTNGGIILSYSANSKMINNTASSNTSTAITIDDVNNYILNNTAISISGSGIVLFSTNTNTTLINNTANSGSGYAIYFISSSGYTLINNNATSDEGHAVYMQAASNNVFTNNYFESKGNQRGVFVWSGSTNNSFTSNTIKSYADIALFVLGANNNAFINNTVTSTTSSAIIVQSSHDNILINNTGTSVSDSGIMLFSANRNILTNNIGNSSSGGGIIIESSYNNTLVDSTGLSNSNYALRIANSHDNNITNVAAVSATYRAVLLSGSDNNILTRLNATSSSFALFILDATGNKISDCVDLNGSTQVASYSNNARVETNYLINCSYASEVVSPGYNIELIRQWWLTANVSNSAGSPVSGVLVSTYNNTGGLDNSAITNDGVTRYAVTEYKNIDGIRYYANNITVNATKIGYKTNSSTYNLTTETNLQVNLALDYSDPITNCQTLSSAGYYTLINNVTSDETCFDVQASDVVIDCAGHTIMYSTSGLNNTYGVFSQSYEYTTVKNCVINDGNWSGNASRDGLYFVDSLNNMIYNNTINVSNGNGIRVWTSQYTNITSNTVYTNDISAIFAIDSGGIIIDDNTAINTNGNDGYGIHVELSPNSIIRRNNVVGQKRGMFLSYNSGLGNYTVTDNNISSSAWHGLYIRNLHDSRVYRNNISAHWEGIHLSLTSSNNNFINNTITTSHQTGGLGLYSWNAFDNTFINNNFSNNFNGVLITSEASGYTFINNTFTTNVTNALGIHLEGTLNMEFVGNKIITTGLGSRAVNIGYNNNYTRFQDCMNISGVGHDVHVGENVTNLTFLNCSYNLSKETVMGSNSELFRQWWLNANVSNSTGSPVSEALVSTYNNIGGLDNSADTDSNGITRYAVTEYKNIDGARYYANNITVNATKTGYTTNSSSYNLTTETNLQVNLALDLSGPMSSCQTISSAGYYTLINNVSSDGTCFIINANDVTLDCNNNWINYSILGAENTYGVRSNNNNVVVKNCNIIDGNWTSTNFRTGIALSANTDNNTFFNNFVNASIGAFRSYGSTNLNIISNLFISINESAAGFTSSHDAWIFNNTFQSENLAGSEISSSHRLVILNNSFISDSGIGLNLITSDNAIMTDNNFTSNSSSALRLYDSTKNNLTRNRGISNSGAGLNIYYGANNNTFTDIIVSTNSIYPIALTGADNNTFIRLNSTTTHEYGRGVTFEESKNNLLYDCAEIYGEYFDVFVRLSGSTNNTLLNCSYSDESFNADNNYLVRQWWLSTDVKNSTGSPISGALVSTYNNIGGLDNSADTDGNGITRYAVTEYKNINGTRYYANNITVHAIKSGYRTSSSSHNLTTEKNLNLVITLILASQQKGVNAIFFGGGI